MICNRGPNPGDDSQCTAAVLDTGSSPTTPSGIVRFVANNGGTFRSGADCTLTPSQTQANDAECHVTYIPNASGDFPDLTAAYQGDASHATSSARTHLVTGAVFGLPANTPLTPATCQAAAPAVTQAAGRGAAKSGIERFRALYNIAHENPLTTSQPVTMGGFASYCLVNLWYNAEGGAVRIGQAASVVGGIAAVPAGIYIAVTDPEPVGKRAGVAIAVSGPGIAYGGYQVGESAIRAIDRTKNDPPDRHFRVLAVPHVRRALVVRPSRGFSRADARRLTALLAAQALGDALGGALATSIDRAGGARVARNAHFLGLQTRTAIRYARRLATLLDGLVPATRAAARILRRVPGYARTIPARLVASFLRHHRRGLPPRILRYLRRAGYPPADIASLQRIRLQPPGPAVPRTFAALLADPAQLALYRTVALGLRYYIADPGTQADARLR